ncbi:hypothetical protein [Segniliparus rugosus]|uniref:Uncharacterized protein n=1 Tax=Segniliparus rugosus (strain ATCC BAA-974 / DSM 45345 / CCUG 50838 / CIP 108380 / JCM 13579 / CDC 945) TaxID=679197 RepID=E5XPX8_SEGRC|nr:hypothetical protein [Segniliparus rugosus]EFV13595.1 hypothetical protein HMPREF9336_01550 [Segniliparus rugosus ATCC BAA-974]
MVDFHVVPEALKKNAEAVVSDADRWKNASNVIEQHKLHPGDLGLPGSFSDIPGAFNRVLDLLIQKMRQGESTIRSAGEELGNVANEYENKDFEYYQQFGYTNDKIGAVEGKLKTISGSGDVLYENYGTGIRESGRK